MAVTRRKSARTARKRSTRTLYPPSRDRIYVSFIGDEIDKAIRAISSQGQDLPRRARSATKVAARTLRKCKRSIKMAVRCRAWGL